MPLMNLLVAFNGSDSSETALRYAASLARGRGAHVTAILAHATHDAFDTSSRWIPDAARALLAEAKSSILTDVEKRLEALRPQLDLGDALSFRTHAGRVDTVLAEFARGFDALLVGQPLDSDDDHVRLHPDKIALLSGRPVIVVPDGYDAATPHSHAALAWDGGRAAARALSDSLRLLEVEGRVSVLTVGAPLLLPEIETHLERHGITSTHEGWPEGMDVADAILGWCERHDPSLLVIGAYEHSKFREDLLGGHTAAILRKISIPVLLSH